MNLHYEIFHKLLPLYERTAKYIQANGGNDLSFSEELCYMVMSSCNFRLGNQLDKLLHDDEFCIFCMYANINNIRKSTSRYLSIEKEINTEASILLKDMFDSTNSVCVSINNNYSRDNEGCRIVENLAIDSITLGDMQRIKDNTLNSIDDFDDDDDDDIKI